MMRQMPSVIAVAAIALGLLSKADWAVARASDHALSAAAKKSAPARRPVGQIACTIDGCHPIPPGCHPEMGYSWDGIPTGFDIVVCGPKRGRYR